MSTPSPAEIEGASALGNGREGGAAGSGAVGARQRVLLHRVGALFEERAKREAAIEKEFAGATGGADRALRAALEAADEELTAGRVRATEEFEKAAARTTKEYEARLGVIRKGMETGKQQIAKATDSEEGAAARSLKDRVWAAETIFEGNEGKPGLEYDLTKKEIEKKLTDHGATETAAGVVLGEYRQGLKGEEAGERPAEWTEPEGSEAERYEAYAKESRERLARLAGRALPRFYSNLAVPVILVVLAGGGAAVVAAWQSGWVVTPVAGLAGGGTVILLSTVLVLLSRVSRRQVREMREPLVWMLAATRRVAEAWRVSAAEKRDRLRAALVQKRDDEVQGAKAKYEPLILAARLSRSEQLAALQAKNAKERAELEVWRQGEAAAVAAARDERLRAVESAGEAARRGAEAVHEEATRGARARHEEQWRELVESWDEGLRQAEAELGAMVEADRALFPGWEDPAWGGWKPRGEPAREVRFGEVEVDLAALPGGMPRSERLAAPGAAKMVMPASLVLPDHASVFIKHGAGGRAEAIGVVQTLMLRLLLSLPPGKARFTIIDPVGLGESFAGFMHLADYEEALVGGKIWTETRHIEQRLVDLTEHMENVIQKYLRNEFRTIAEYNAQAGEIAEPYRFLVIADFPANFNEQSAARLAAICASGARCGVHTLVTMDTRQQVPPGVQLSDLERHSVRLSWKEGAGDGGRMVWDDKDFAGLPLRVDGPPGEDAFNELIHRIGVAAKDSNRVQVPFDLIAPSEEDLWSADTASDLRVPLGRCGATKLQYLTLGRGTAQHVLIAGKTGSGKSTLLHALVTNLAMWFSPDEVQFYLVDFKKGVEFKSYATHNLAHARAVAIESDREFGLSVLQRLDAELKRRGNLFRDLGVQDVTGFRRKTGAGGEPMPRVLLIIDEFQEFFTEDDKLSQDATLLMDRLVRQGRAFGIHVVLGSQTLSGAYNLARSTMGQMGVRIALQCSESDSYLILSEDNAAARLLSRPGEAIYNDASGLLEGNSPFQIAWLSDEKRDRYLERIAERTRASGYRPPEPQAVFEGNVPSDVRRNGPLNELLAKKPSRRAAATRVWLGDAIAIKDPTCAVLRRQTASNVLIVGQRDEAALAMMAVALAGIGAQHGTHARVYVLDGTAPDSPHAGLLERAAGALPMDTRVVAMRDVPGAMGEIAAELARRQELSSDDQDPVFVLVNGIQRFRGLRKAEDEFSFSMDEEKKASPEKQFAELLREGPVLGMHAVVWCDTAANSQRALDRGGLKEFDWRVLFQVSTTDSSMMIDSPEAGKLGLHRALLYSDEQGTIEKFRPYALPDEGWVAELGEGLRSRG